jgi:hypothetical protein
MRLSKFLSITGFLTLLSLLYVYQQTEIFRLAYVGQNKSSFCQDLLDKNSILRYNIGKRASLVSIGSRISGSADFQMPESYRLVRLTPAREGLRTRNQLPNRQTLASRLFGIKREAEANTINP